MSNPVISFVIRGIFVVAVAILIFATWQVRIQRSAAMSEIAGILENNGVTQAFPRTARRLMRELDPQWARLGTARILATESRETSVADLPNAEEITLAEMVKRLQKRLDISGNLAAQVGRERPAVWQASMWRGATTYLSWSIDRDPRLLSRRSEWELPLLRASDLAPGREQPRRFLAAAYLEIWPALTDDEIPAAKKVLSTAMGDPTYLRAFIGPWLAQASDIDEAFNIIPDDPVSWSSVRSHFGRVGDYRGFTKAHRVWELSVDRKLRDLLSEMERSLAGGDPSTARRIVASVVSLAPPDARYIDQVAEAMLNRPPGPGSPSEERGSKAWLKWSLEAATRGEVLMPPVVFERLAASVNDLSEAERATALVASENLNGAENIERRREDLNTEAWAPYCLNKARLLAARGDRQGARVMLNRMHRSMRSSPAAVKVAVDLSGTDSGAQPWWQSVPGLASTAWSGLQWKWRDRQAWLDFVSEEPSNGLVLVLDVVPSTGAVIEIQVDFRGVWTGAVEPDQEIELDMPMAPGAHTLRVRNLAGGRVVPGAVSLRENANS
ncbi:MAG: hypothetical protein DRJ65_06060 [Acidobacteria bacterium]|nr:MAG: hypothetical protein DRJ65_06060 [Acidobacteriota bacterium]